MIEDISNFLKNAEEENVKLFFIKRKKSQSTGNITYKTFRSNINAGIGKELIESAKKQIDTIIRKNPGYEEYGVIFSSDSLVIDYINKDDVSFLGDMIEDISDPHLDIIPDDEFTRIHGYIVRIEVGNGALFLFRKYASKKLLEKDKIAAFIGDGQLNKVEKAIIALDRIYDATLLMKGDSISSKVFILNRSKFESFFSFIEIYSKEIEDNKEDLERIKLIENVNEFISFCASDSRKIKKLAQILRDGKADNIDRDKIKRITTEFRLNIEFTDDGKLKPTKENIWVVLRILNDDYLKSDVTGSKYETHSKVKK